MSDKKITSVRLVKCPKCSRVLPEVTHVPVYRCGGCGVVLQAKNCKTKLEDRKSVSPESPLDKKVESGNTSDNKDSCSPSPNGTATGNISDVEQTNYCQKNNSANCVSDTEGGKVSKENCVVNEVLASEDGNSGQNEQKKTACDGKQASSGLDHHPVTTVASPSYISGSDSKKLPFDRKSDLPVECQSEEDIKGSKKVVYHENSADSGSADVDADELLVKRKRRPVAAACDTLLVNTSLPIEAENVGPESVSERASAFSSPVSEDLQSFLGNSPSPNTDDAASGSSYSNVIQSLPIKKAEHSQTSSPNAYASSVNRANELEGTEAAVPSSSKLSSTLGKMSKSETRSGYCYDGSTSSYEDQYDQIHKQNFRDKNYVENDGKRNSNANQVSSIAAVQQQAKEFFSEKNHQTVQDSSWSPMESDELVRRRFRNKMGLEADKYPSGVPFTTRGYENDGFSSDCWDGVRSDSSIYSADKLPYTEKKRVELLKMVHELQEELGRPSTSKGNVDRRKISQFENIPHFSNGRQMPINHRHREFMDEANLQSKYPRYPISRSEQGTNWPRQQNRSWVPHSGEVTNHRHYDEHYCQHRQPVDQRFSAQLAPSVCSLNTGLQRIHLHPGDQFRYPYSSSASSDRRQAESDFASRVGDMTYGGRRHMESDFPSRVPTYGDQRLMERYVEASLMNSSIATDHVLKDEMKKNYAREKQLRVKRQIRPIAGGAPFITCYHCWSMLQLPADSFLFKLRFHKLKCGSCSKILKYSVEDRTHIVPQVHDYGAHPCEVKGSQVNTRTSNTNISSHSRGILMSRSDHEFGRSFSATEGKHESLGAPSHVAQASDGTGRKASSGGSPDILEGKKKRFSKPLFSKEKRPMGSPETCSTNRTFNIEDYSLESKAPKSRAGSPLHKLMGYTSISQVFRGQSLRNKSTR